MVLGKYENEKDTTKGEPKGPRANRLIDRLAEADDKTEFINTLDNNGRKALTNKQQGTQYEAKHYMIHAPVI